MELVKEKMITSIRSEKLQLLTIVPCSSKVQKVCNTLHGETKNLIFQTLIFLYFKEKEYKYQYKLVILLVILLSF